MNLFKYLALLPGLLQVISSLVQQTEALLPGIPGATKLQTVLAAANAYLDKLEADAGVITQLKTMIEPLVESAVALFNASGLFQHGTASTAGAASA